MVDGERKPCLLTRWERVYSVGMAELTREEILAKVAAKESLNGADLRELDLCDAALSGANLSRANLSGTDIISANLSKANLSGANLKKGQP